MDDIAEKRWKVLWGVQRSIRYHARRQGFFETWRRVTAFASVLLASAATADLLHAGDHSNTIALVASFAVAALSAFDLVVDTSGMARRHDDPRRRFVALEARFKPTATTTVDDITSWREERLKIEIEEPPIFVAVDLLCGNELRASKGMKVDVVVPFWRRISANWWRQEDLQALRTT